MGNCCTAPRPDGGEEAVRKPTVNGGAHRQAGQQRAVPPLSLGGVAGSGRQQEGSNDAPLTFRSEGWYTAVDGGLSDGDEEWYDAVSEVDLAEALEEWEEEGHWHDAEVDQAIQVLKAHGHLLPRELEAAAIKQQQEDLAAEQLQAALEGAPRVHVAAVPTAGLKLERSRSLQLRSALQQPGAQQLLQQVAELAANGRVLAAHARLQQVAAQVGCALDELAALPSAATSAALPAGASLDVGQVLADVQRVNTALEELEDHTGWMVSRSDALQVYYRHQRGTTIHSLKFRAVFDHPVEHLLALAHEFDLITTWNKFTIESFTVAEPSIFESYLYGAQWMMRPFKPMQGLLRARGFDLAEEHRCLLVSVEDCPPDQLPPGSKPLPPEFGRRKLVNFRPGSCVKLRPLPPGPDGGPRTDAAMLLHIDPHIPFIPAFLLNFVLGVLSPYVFKQMGRVLDSSFADEAGEFPRRIAAQPQLYGLVRQRMAEFAEQLAAEAAEEAAKREAGGGEEVGRRRSGRRARRRTTSSTSATA